MGVPLNNSERTNLYTDSERFEKPQTLWFLHHKSKESSICLLVNKKKVVMQKEKITLQNSKTNKQDMTKTMQVCIIRTNRARRWYGEDSDMIDELW